MIFLLQPVEPVFAMQLYWASIVFIGWAVTKTALKITKGRFVHEWPRLPVAAKLVIATALAFALFSVFTVIGYALSLPPWWLKVTYIGSLLYAVIYTLRSAKTSPVHLARSSLRTILDIRLLSPLGVLIILAGADLVLTFLIGGFMGADGFIHISKVRHLTLDGFTLTDAYYGTVPETRHTLSVTHTLMAIPSSFGINPITSWYASAAFFKLVKINAVFYLAWRLLYRLKGSLRIQYAALASILPLALYNNYFISYPAYFVAVWVMLFTIALFDVAKRQNFWLLIVASLLIAFTHPLAAMAVALLLCLVVLGWLTVDRRLFTKRFILGLFAAMALLLSTSLFAASLPNQMADSVRNFGAKDMAYYRLGSYVTLRPTRALYFDTPSALSWTISLLSLLGVVGLFVFIKDKYYRCVVAGAVLIVPLTLYNPVPFAILKKHLPVWAIARFTVADQLTLVMVFFGLAMLCVGIFRLIKLSISNRALITLLLGVVTITFMFTQSYGAVEAGQGPNLSMYKQQSMVMGDLQDIKQVLPNDKYATVLAERTWDSFIIPVVAPLRVVAIHDNNSTPAADMIDRSACYEKVYASLDPGLLKQIGVKYVLAKRGEPAFYQLAVSSPVLTKIKSNSDRTLFIFNSAGIQSAHDPVCYFKEP